MIDDVILSQLAAPWLVSGVGASKRCSQLKSVLTRRAFRLRNWQFELIWLGWFGLVLAALKTSAFFAALCFCATPSFAGDVIYLKCDLDVLKQTKDLKTRQILETTKEKDSTVSKVDLVNKRIIGSRSSEWQDVEIVDGVVSYQSEEIDDGVF